MGLICFFFRALPASIWGHCSQVLVFTSICWNQHEANKFGTQLCTGIKTHALTRTGPPLYFFLWEGSSSPRSWLKPIVPDIPQARGGKMGCLLYPELAIGLDAPIRANQLADSRKSGDSCESFRCPQYMIPFSLRVAFRGRFANRKLHCKFNHNLGDSNANLTTRRLRRFLVCGTKNL